MFTEQFIERYLNQMPSVFAFTEKQIETLANNSICQLLDVFKPTVYISQMLTPDNTQSCWVKTLDIMKESWSILDTSNPLFINPTLTKQFRVKLDLFLCFCSDLILVDFTKGSSVGVSAEITVSRILNKPIIGIANSDQNLSIFVEVLCSSVITPEQLKNVVDTGSINNVFDLLTVGTD